MPCQVHHTTPPSSRFVSVLRYRLGIGHACGHNLIATSSIAAFLALSFALKKFGIPGRAQLLGTPAEENGGGKAVLIDAGAYKNVDISLMAYDSQLPNFLVNSMAFNHANSDS